MTHFANGTVGVRLRYAKAHAHGCAALRIRHGTESQYFYSVQLTLFHLPNLVEFNLIATQCNIDATKYLIPQSKKKGKFEKFGFYCSKCDAYMTGQIQLVMVSSLPD